MSTAEEVETQAGTLEMEVAAKVMGSREVKAVPSARMQALRLRSEAAAVTITKQAAREMPQRNLIRERRNYRL